jgi:hypothetical protein
MATEYLSPTGKTNPTSGYGQCYEVNAAQDSIKCRPQSSCENGALDQDGAELHTFSSSNQADWDAAADLKVTWKIFGLGSDDTCSTKQVKLEYKLASTWIAFSGWPKNATGSSQTGTATASGVISKSQNLANVKVRMIVRTASCDPCDDGGDPGDPVFCCKEYDSELGRWVHYHVTDCNNCTLSECNAGSC